METSTESDATAAVPRRLNPWLKSGTAILGAGFLMAAAAAGVLAQGSSQFEEVAGFFHYASLFVMLAGLCVILIGHRVQAARRWWEQAERPRLSAALAISSAEHLGCWEAQIDGGAVRMELRAGGQGTLVDNDGAREVRYEIRYGAGVVELRLEQAQHFDSDYSTRSLSPYTRQTRMVREFVVTETFYSARFLDSDRLQVAPSGGGFPPADSERCFVFRRQRS